MKRVCVFTGSSPGARPEYAAAAQQFGAEIAGRGYELVYGGGRVGLMGVIADAVLASGGRVIGVIPENLVAKEIGHSGLTELRIVKSMHERKALMADLSDAFVAMPGGIGTMEEFFEVLTWAQLGLHAKPCGLLQVAGYFDALLALLDRAVQERFVKAEHMTMLIASVSPTELLDRLAAYRAPLVDKWIDRRSS
ncbi:MAG TPA: TIGR00730 family Rossman fold protein [Steroidobacteraceae bacterium]|nr:TIGR00730 family Rossman fold protein [Steroidobacteraceae bacterium]